MFVALRDILHAKGRFTLMIGVIALLTLLLVLLTGLTRGLAHQNISAIEALPADAVAFTPTLGDEVSWADSQVSTDQARVWADADGLSTEPLSVGQMRIEAGDAVTSLALFGIAPDGQVAAELPDAPAEGEALLPADIAEALDVAAGDTVSVNGQDLTVAGIVETQWYSHSPVGYVHVDTFCALAHQAEDTAGSALLVREEAAGGAAGSAAGGAAGSAAGGSAEDEIAAAAAESGTRAVSVAESLSALPSYSSENGSLTLIQGFLYGISALVTIAFLSVWTIQRTRDIAVLRALGASARYVLRDTVGQAAILLAVGTAAGGLVGAGGGAALSTVAPFESSAVTVLLPVAGVLAIGLLGSVLATRRVTRVDPLLALGGN
ncbi:ABC transporter permease [Brachybacterium saurashtrense]|uniref:ABC transporter permease n=1 Tax=Brachybacterium saurashtrense TaxID=556288 RepID=A0A345YRU0_9MICO|nr:ABC transporter permease [Brachybacterium saurashtrense]AXK46642.1 ABC transporter permease [Brachybacterium saurashtrense]RRR22356.1 ABC transporter permease [Brachybacterium saurashtrense]